MKTRAKFTGLSLVALCMLIAGCKENKASETGKPSASEPTSEPTSQETSKPETSKPNTDKPETSNTSNPGTTDEPGTTTPVKKDLAYALSLDYTNITVATTEAYITDANQIEATEEYALEYYYNGYTIVQDTSTGNDATYLYYHNYQGESYQFFKATETGEVDAWCKKGYADAALGLGTAYFNLEWLLADIDPAKASYMSGMYIIEDPVSLSTFNTHSFDFSWCNTISAVGIEIDPNTGYLTRVTGFPEDVNDDKQYVKIQFGEYGTTVFNGKLPAEPDSTNVMEFYQHKGWDSPKEPVYASTVTLTPDARANIVDNKVVLEIEEKAKIKYDILPADYDKKGLTFHYQNNNMMVCDVGYSYDNGYLEVTGLEAGEVEIWVRAVGKGGEDTGVESNHITIKVNPIKSQNLEGQVYDLSFTALQDGLLGVKNNIENNLPVSAKANKASIINNNSSSVFPNNSGALVMNPSQLQPSNTDAYAEFDFSDQQVSSVSFYYGMYYTNHLSNLSAVDEAVIETSNDGETWTSAADILAEIKANISENNFKLMEKSFAPASKVRIRLSSNFIGKSISFALNNIDFMADKNCHNHVVTPKETEVASIDFSITDTDVKVGEEIPFSYIINPSIATDKSFTGISSNPAVVKFENGKFTAIAAGTSDLSLKATNEVTSNVVTVTVVEKVEMNSKLVGSYKGETDSNDDAVVTISADGKMVMTIGSEVFNLTYDDQNSDGYYLFNGTNGTHCGVKLDTYSASKILNFSSGSTFVGASKTHTINKFGTHDGFATYVAATAIKLTTNKDRYFPSDSGKIYATFTPSNTTARSLTYASSDESVILFDSADTNTFMCLKAGTATLTATNEDGVVGSIEVTVSSPVKPTSLSLSLSKTTIKINESSKVSVTTTPAEVDDKEFTYASLNETVATVDELGNITGKAAGKATIKVSLLSDPTINATIDITVEAASKDVIPAANVGTYTGGDLYGLASDVVIDLRANGTMTITNNDAGESDTLTFNRMQGNDFIFASDSNSAIELLVTLQNASTIYIENLNAEEDGTYLSMYFGTDGSYTSFEKQQTMTKSYLLPSLLSLLVLASCSNGPVSETPLGSDTEPTSVETKNEESFSSNERKIIWDEEFDTTCLEYVGTVLPYIENNGYSLTLTTDDYGDPLIKTLVYFNSEEDLNVSCSTYSGICEAAGYQISFETVRSYDPSTMTFLEYDCYYADMMLTKKKAIELQFLLGADSSGRDCLGIFAFNYINYDKTKWPSVFVEDLIGHDIPHLDDPSYTYSAFELTDEKLGNYVEIVQHGTEFADEERYKTLFEENGLVINSNYYDAGEGYYAYDASLTYCINFVYDTNHYNAMLFYVFLNQNI